MAVAADYPVIGASPPGKSVYLSGMRVRGFITGTYKKAGLYVFGLDGRKLQFLPDGLLNNVDLRIATVGGREQVILGASDRGRMGIALYIFDPASTNPANVVRPKSEERRVGEECVSTCRSRWQRDP